MENKEVRKALQEKKLKQWQLADMLGINEFTLSRKLRKELPPEEKKKILDIIAAV